MLFFACCEKGFHTYVTGVIEINKYIYRLMSTLGLKLEAKNRK